MNKKTILITGLLTISPMIFGLLNYTRLPATMVTHWGINGEPNGYSSRTIVVFGLPLFLLVILMIAAFATTTDPKHTNVSAKIRNLVPWIVPTISLFIFYVIYANALGYHVDVSSLSMMLIGIMFIIIGNYMPKTRQNYTIGIRVPWTLDDEDNWNATHRFAGKLWFFGGLAFLIMCFLQLVNPVILIIYIFIITLIPIIYSYMYSKR